MLDADIASCFDEHIRQVPTPPDRILSFSVLDLHSSARTARTPGVGATPQAAQVWVVLPTYNEAENLEHFFQVELPLRALRAAFRVVEVPIVFRERRQGKSKMTTRIVAEAVWRVLAMRLKRRTETPKASLSGRLGLPSAQRR